MTFFCLAVHEAHDASCCLMADGVVIAAIQKERISRLKCDYGISKQAMEYCLNVAGIEANQLNVVALCSLNWNPVLTKVKRNANFSVEDFVIEQNNFWAYELGLKKWTGSFQGRVFSSIDSDGEIKYIPENKPWKYYNLFKDRSDFIYDEDYEWTDKVLNGYMDKIEMMDMRSIRARAVSKMLGVSEDKIVFVEHEKCHQYYAYYGSKLSENNKAALILTNEGIGDYSNCSVSYVDSFGFMHELEYTAQCNIGRIYQFITLLLGMKIGQHEYKTMGLAAYASQKELDKSYEVFKDIMKVDGLNIVFNKRPKDLYFHFRDALQGHRFDGIAGAVQKMIEVLLVQWVKNCIKYTGIKNIVFAGGVGQNIKACKAISEIPEVENIDVLPACGDASLSIGACYYITNRRGIKTEPLSNVYLGPEPNKYSNWIKFIVDNNCDYNFNLYEVSSNLISDLLIEGKVIGRCDGKMEFGNRALGNRSILADPRNPNIVKKINDMIKMRDFWMPFSATILDTYEKKYIVNPKNLNAKFMTMAFDSTESARVHIPAALHPADLTVRPQVLKKEDNPEYYDIIKSFEEKTGVGALLNTSLNIHGMPIDCSAEDALNTFENSGLDAIIIDDFLVEKKG